MDKAGRSIFTRAQVNESPGRPRRRAGLCAGKGKSQLPSLPARPGLPVWLGLALALTVGLACNASGRDIRGDVANDGTESAAMTEASGEMSLAEALAIQPQDGRPEVLRLMGQPDTFRLSFHDLDGTTVRLEEWSYYDYESRFDFVDGELLWTVDIEPLPDGSIFAQYYDPLAFPAYASSADVQSLLGGISLTSESLADLDFPDASLRAGPQILLGFDTDRLVFVETFALSPEAMQ